MKIIGIRIATFLILTVFVISSVPQISQHPCCHSIEMNSNAADRTEYQTARGYQAASYNLSAADNSQNGAAPYSATDGLVAVNDTHPAVTEGRAGSAVNISEIYGLTPDSVILANSTSVNEYGGEVVNATNHAYVVSGTGTVLNFTFTIATNLSEGPFGIIFSSNSTDFEVRFAGIVSEPGDNPSLYVFPYVSESQGNVSVVGAGLRPNASIGYAVVGNYSFNETDTSTDAYGAVVVSLVLPPLPEGPFTVRVTDYPSALGNGMVVPGLSLASDSGHVGSHLLAFLSGFPANSMASVSWSGTDATVTGRTNSSGGMIALLRVPPLSYGLHYVVASVGSAFKAYTSYSITSPSLILSSHSAPAGGSILVTGMGFPSHSVVELKISLSGPTGASGIAAMNGTVTINFSVPRITSGLYTLRLVANSTLSSNDAVLEVKPVLMLSIHSVHADSRMYVTGMYFAPDTPVSLEIPGYLLLGTYMSTGNGSLSASVTVPEIGGGPFSIIASQPDGYNSSPVLAVIVPSLSLQAYSGYPGEHVLLSGKGFLPGSVVRLLWDGKPTAYSATANRSGVLRISFPIPPSQPGTYLISVNNTSAGYAVFTVKEHFSFLYFLPALLLPFITGIISAMYVYRRHRILGRRRRS